MSVLNRLARVRLAGGNAPQIEAPGLVANNAWEEEDEEAKVEAARLKAESDRLLRIRKLMGENVGKNKIPNSVGSGKAVLTSAGALERMGKMGHLFPQSQNKKPLKSSLRGSGGEKKEGIAFGNNVTRSNGPRKGRRRVYYGNDGPNANLWVTEENQAASNLDGRYRDPGADPLVVNSYRQKILANLAAGRPVGGSRKKTRRRRRRN